MTFLAGATSEREAVIADILAQHQTKEGALLPILHDVQKAFGYVPQEVLPQIAKALQLSNAEVWGVVSFYHDFRQEPAGRHVVKLCRAEACQAMGSDALAAEVKQSLGLEWNQTSADGRVSLEPVFCLGLCACGPAALVDDQLHARLDADRLKSLIGGLV